MTKKIKKYKISLRPSFVLRNLKKKVSPEFSKETLEEKIKEETKRIQELIQPSSVYDSFSRDETPEFIKPLWANSSSKSLSLSVAATTIGPSLDQEISQARAENKQFKADLIAASASEGLEQSLNFIMKLLNEEAKSEGCECSPPWVVESTSIKNCLELLQTSRIDIQINSDGMLSPLYSNLSYCFWNPLPKK